MLSRAAIKELILKKLSRKVVLANSDCLFKG